MKSEPDAFSIADLERVEVEPWTGVRNYMARNYMREMAVGDEVLFHHSNADPPGVAGLARVVRTGIVDETQFDPASPYHDPRSTRARPLWDCVEVAYVATLPHLVTMERLRAEPALADMVVLRRGMRLSVQPVTEAEYARIVELGHTPPAVTRPPAVTKPPAASTPAVAARRAASTPAVAAKRAGSTPAVAAKRAASKPAAKGRARR